MRVEHSMCLRSCALLACGRPVCAGTTAMPPLSCEQCRSIFGSAAVCIFLARPRPKGTSAEMWGPSQRISKIRECIIADHDGHNQCHPWMSQASKMDMYACKHVGQQPALGLHYLPDELPNDVWEAVGAYVDNFALGTEEILKPTNGPAAGC